MSNEYITVKVGVPGKIKDVVLSDGRTLSAALAEAGLTLEGFEIRVNGLPVDTKSDQELHDGDVIFGAKPITGNIQ